MKPNPADLLPLTSADVYATNQAFINAINLWSFILPLQKKLKWWQWVLLGIGILIIFGGLINATQDQDWQWKLLGVTISCVAMWVLCWGVIELVRRDCATQLEARKKELGAKNKLPFDELQFVKFRDTVPQHVRNIQRIVQLQEQIRASQVNRRSLIAELPFGLAILTLIVGISSGLASQDHLRDPSLATLYVLVLVFITTRLFSTSFVGKAELENKRLDYLERLKLEPLHQVTSRKLGFWKMVLSGLSRVNS